MDEGGSLENCWAGFPVPWVQIPPSPRPTHPASDRHQAGGSLLAPGAWSLNRRGGRVDEGGSLENCWARLGLVGSNPTPTAACADRVSPPTRRRNPSRPRQTNPSPVAARRACCEGARSRCSAARWTGSNPAPSARRTAARSRVSPPEGGSTSRRSREGRGEGKHYASLATGLGFHLRLGARRAPIHLPRRGRTHVAPRPSLLFPVQHGAPGSLVGTATGAA